jgi:hypothetical protein
MAAMSSFRSGARKNDRRYAFGYHHHPSFKLTYRPFPASALSPTGHQTQILDESFAHVIHPRYSTWGCDIFSSQTPADKLAAALAAYQADFEKKLRARPSPDAEEARQRIERAEELVRQSGLGPALVVLLEHTKYWPSWSKREDFRNYVGFPVGGVLAKEQRDERKFNTTKITIVCFSYGSQQYALVFKDEGGMSLPDGEVYYSGTVEFVTNSETVLGLSISQDKRLALPQRSCAQDGSLEQGPTRNCRAHPRPRAKFDEAVKR